MSTKNTDDSADKNSFSKHMLAVGVSEYTEAPTSVKRVASNGILIAQEIHAAKPRYEKLNFLSVKKREKKVVKSSTYSEVSAMLNVMRTGQMVEVHVVYRPVFITASKNNDITIMTKKWSETEIAIVKLAPYFVNGDQRRILLDRYETMELQDFARYVMAKVKPNMPCFPHLLEELESIGLAHLIPENYPRDRRSLEALLGKVVSNKLHEVDKLKETFDKEGTLQLTSFPSLINNIIPKIFETTTDADIANFL